MSKHPEDWKSPKPHPKPDHADEKISIPSDVMDLVNSIVQDINKLNDVLKDVQSNNYGKAVTDLLAVVNSIVVDMILPRLKIGK